MTNFLEDEQFYEITPSQATSPRYGADLICRKTLRKICNNRKAHLDSQKSELQLREYRDYALKKIAKQID